MNQPRDFDSELRDGMNRASRHVVADAELRRRLLDTASTAQQSERSSWFRAQWAPPLAAAAVILVVVGSVVGAEQLSSGRTTSGVDHGVIAADTSTPARAPTPSVAVTTAPTSPLPPSTTPPALSTSPDVSTTPPLPVTTTSNIVQPPPPSPPRPPSCLTPDTGAYVPTSVQDFTDHVLGTWLVCSTPTAFGTDEDGVQIKPDGTWAKLTRNSAGELIAGRSSLTKGTWVVIDDTAANSGRPTFQLNLNVAGSGTVIAAVYFSTGVTRMRVDNNGTYSASYVPTTQKVY